MSTVRRDIPNAEIVKKLANGLTVKDIAAEYRTSTWLIWQRVKRLHRRHKAKNTVHLVFILTSSGKLK